MAIGISEEHEALRRTVAGFAEHHSPSAVVRAAVDADDETLPVFWKDLAAQGWLGLAVPTAAGGEGAGVLGAAVVTAELTAAMAPGPFLPTLLAATALGTAGAGADPQLLASLLDGSTPAGALLSPATETDLAVTPDGDDLVLTGTLRPVLSATTATVVLAPVPVPEGHDGGHQWVVLTLVGDAGVGDGDGHAAAVAPVASLDLVRRLGAVTLDGLGVAAAARLTGAAAGRVDRLVAVLAAAECAGGARWCLETATQHAKDRRQFGRPIGQFQAIKHRLADMLVMVEQASALVWDAARAVDDADADAEPAGSAAEQAALSAELACGFALDAYVRCAQGCVQVLGGMGFTWEHDAHLHLRRAIALRQLCGGSARYRAHAAGAAVAGRRRVLEGRLPAGESERIGAIRAELGPVLAAIAAATDSHERRRLLAEAGLIAPHWPAPWGRHADALEQLVIDEELAAAGVRRPVLAVGAWALPTIIAHGTEEQQHRFVGPTLAGELVWCQLFSEPGAGSDLAALQTRAERVEGGFMLTGQKVWTSVARRAQYGICLARTDPDAAKHAGITYFIVDMHTAGLDVRPLREITGEAMFNEVFLTDVFVPDDCVVGEVNGGWRLARTTLANERVSMSSGATFGFGIEMVLGWLAGRPAVAGDGVVVDTLGRLLGEAQSLAILGERATLRSVSGTEPGPEASVRKLAGGEHEQEVQEFALSLLGAEGATTEGDAAVWARGFLSTRCLTIAGGTSEVQRNVIGERLLGLLRDPRGETVMGSDDSTGGRRWQR